MDKVKKNYNKVFGCLIGGAVGDALGYPIEFDNEDTIFGTYGNSGICDYVLQDGKALVSDDTQMTLFTANALILTDKSAKYPDFIVNMYNAYKEWLSTQTSRTIKKPKTWIFGVPELHARRAPGNTCLSALMREDMGCIDEPINNSKGCGGVMRVAPVGLFYNPEILGIKEIDRRGAQTAALTHGHPLGYLSAAGLVHIINKVCFEPDITLQEAAEDMISALCKDFEEDCPGFINQFSELMQKAISLAGSDVSDLDAIHQLGEGWVGEETLAIALFCSLRYQNDFEKAIIVSVNHKGDSDSTGAVTGNILGAYLGADKIPDKYLRNLEMTDVIEKLAYQICDY